MIKFKPELRQNDFFRLNPLLLVRVSFFAANLQSNHNMPTTITSMLRRKTTDSGVHETGRAIDISSHDFTPLWTVKNSLTIAEINGIVDYMNEAFPRNDGRKTIIYHDVGLGAHFHLQVPPMSWWDSSEAENIKFVNAD